MKICSTCGVPKDESEYSRRPNGTFRGAQCKSCIKKQRAKHYLERAAENRTYSKNYYAENTQQCIAASKKWYKEHPERVRENDRNWSANNRERSRENNKRDREKHPERVRLQEANWRKENPDRVREYGRNTSHRRRVRMRSVEVEFFSALEIFERDAWICQLCLELIDQELKWPHPFSISLDHIIPLNSNGPHTRANTQAAHLRCNISKGAKLL